MLNFTPENVLPLKYPTTDPTLPAKGAKAISATCEWAQGSAYQFNLLNAQQQRDFGPLRAIWIDASENTHSITVAVNGTEQLFAVSPGTANYYAVVNLNNPVVSFVLGGSEATVTRVIFLNFIPNIPMLGQTSIVGPVTVAGNVAVTNFPAVQPVSQSGAWAVNVSNFPATQPVSGNVSASQSGVWNVGITNASIAVTQSGAWSVAQSGVWNVGITGTVNDNLTQVGGSAISLGQKTMAASLPVVIASDQSALNVTTPKAVVDATNSTTANLGANATFTGAAVNVLGYSNIRVLLESNASSAANGLAIEFSNDGVNWDDSSLYTYTAGLPAPNQGQSFIAGTRGQFVRVVYTNGAVAQTNFRLQTTLSPTVIGGDVLSINGTVNDNNHGFLTVSQIVGKTTGGGGGYVPVKVNPSGTLSVDASNSTNVATVDNLTAVGGSSITLGTKTAANSIPVVQASDTSGSSLASAIISTSASVSLGLNARNFLRSLQIISVGPVLAAGSVSLTIKDGSATPIYAVTLPVATGTATQPFTIIDFKNIMVTMNNGGNPVTVSLGTNLTSGSFLVSISGSIA